MKRRAVFLAFTFLPTAAPGADVVIDNFTTAQTLILPSGGPGTISSQVSGGGIFGGFRDLVLTRVFGTPTTIASVASNTLFLTSGSDTGNRLEIHFDGGADAGSPGDYPAGGLPAFDLTQSATNTGIFFQALSDVGESAAILPTVTVTLTAGANNFSAAVSLIENGQFENYFIPFSAFPGLGNEATQVTAIRVVIDASTDASQDIALRNLIATAVPTPSGLILGGATVIITAGYVWRRRRHARMAEAKAM